MSEANYSDLFFMKRALDLARKGLGRTSPNPMVGAVLVKNGKILSEGYHMSYGGPHAEVNALRNLSKKQIHGATLYVTLEPCCFQGKTPPCTNFLLSSGVSDLVVAMRDPNPLVAGRGISFLRKHGVAVRVGVLEDEARRLNKVFLKNITKKLPYLSIKLGMTLDGKIATLSGNSKYITNELSRRYVHRLRSQVDAVLTTSETVIRDNPHLGLRMVKGKDPLRVVIDSRLRTSPSSTVYRNKNVLVATTFRSPMAARKRFISQGIDLLIYRGTSVPLKKLLSDLYQRGIYHVMVEAGSGLTTSLLRAGLVDSLILFFAPIVLGKGLPWVQDLGIDDLKDGLCLHDTEYRRFGDNFMISGSI